MAWLRIDDGFAAHPKIASLTDRELRVWLRVLCYCARHTDPTVDHVTCQEVVGLNPACMRRFSDLELLDQAGDDHVVHGWSDYQPRDATGAERQARWRAKRNAERNGARNVTDRHEDRYETVSRARAAAGARSSPSRPLTTTLPPSQSDSDQGREAGRAIDILKDIPA